jgi:hypothetical protein
VSINPVRDILGRVTKDKLSYFKVHFGVTEKCHIGIEHAHIILITQQLLFQSLNLFIRVLKMLLDFMEQILEEEGI